MSGCPGTCSDEGAAGAYRDLVSYKGLETAANTEQALSHGGKSFEVVAPPGPNGAIVCEEHLESSGSEDVQMGPVKILWQDAAMTLVQPTPRV
jgi:hypothetical protein